MSEFQYYEFQAIDRPLDHAAQQALRQISTRAVITSRSLVNTYQWGDFKGNSRNLMAQWFDLFVHFANFGSRTLMLRLPRRYLDPVTIEPYCMRYGLKATAAADHVILEFQRGGEDLLDEHPEVEGLSAPFVALRSELLLGDRRCLYLGWLLGVQDEVVDEDEPEPPRPPGLARLSGALIAFAEFFGLDRDLLDVAAEGDDGGAALPDPSREELAAFIEGLPDADRTALLRRAVLDDDPHVRLDLRLRWQASRSPQAPTAIAREPRTAGELRAAAERRAEQRARAAERRAAAERARREELERLAREQRLAGLAGREEAVWREVASLIEAKLPAEYDRAVALLKDLETLAVRANRLPAFRARMQALRDAHHRKSAFMARLDKAGLGRHDPA